MKSFAETYVAGAAKQGQKWIPIEHAVSLQCLVEVLRNEVERVKAELTKSYQDCERLSGMELSARIERDELGSKLASLRQPPRCPKCGSYCINVESITESEHYVYCKCCDEDEGLDETVCKTVDEALNAWRKE